MMRMPVGLVCALVIAVFAAACGDSSPSAPTTTTAPYSATDLVVGTGAVAGSGSLVTVSYILWLHDSSKTDAKGNQVQANSGFQFRLGTGAVIRGWDQGVPGMRVGGQRRLVLPPDLAYGSTSPSADIPANATLVFDITLISVQ